MPVVTGSTIVYQPVFELLSARFVEVIIASANFELSE